MANYQPVDEAELEGSPPPPAAQAPAAPPSGPTQGYEPVNDNDLAPTAPMFQPGFRGPRGGIPNIPAAAAQRFKDSDAFNNIFQTAATRFANGFVNTFSALTVKDQQAMRDAGYGPGDFNSAGGALRWGAHVFGSTFNVLQDGFLALGPGIIEGVGGAAEQASRETGIGDPEMVGHEASGMAEAAMADVGDMHALSMVDAAKAQAKAQAKAPGVYSQAFRVDQTPGGGIVHTPMGRLPDAGAESIAQAQVAADALHLGPEAATLIHQTYLDTGRPPAEVLMDAKANNGGVLSDLVAGKVPQAYITAYHGSPHQFTEFDASKIGTGEGAQSYGHGLYFAENEGVADSYRQKFEPGKADRPEDVARKILDATGGDRAAAVAEAQNRLDSSAKLPSQYQAQDSALKDALELLKGDQPIQAHLYRVQIAANPEHFLDWDKPLSEQSPHVQQALADLGIKPDQTGGQIAESAKLVPGKFNDKAAASAELQKRAIPGIRYLDQGSRASGAGTRNFVVFDPKDVTITHRNGEPVAKAESEQIKSESMGGRAPATGPIPYTPGTSKIGLSIERKAIEQGLTEGFDRTAGYDVKNVEDQKVRTLDLAMNHNDDARAMIRGEQPVPAGVSPTMLIRAMENYAKETKDGQLQYELANSPLTSGTAYAAQEMRMMQERTPDSATAKFQEIQDAQVKQAGGPEQVKARKAAVKQALSEANGVFLPKEQLSIDKFLDSIMC